MANARMANSDHDSDLYLSFGPINGFDSSFDESVAPNIQIIDLASSDPLHFPEDAPTANTSIDAGLPNDDVPNQELPTGIRPGQIWLNGGVLMCACPDCRAPMSIRFWLMIADCWQCGTSIELTEEQERQAHRLLAADEAAAAKPTPSTRRSNNEQPHAASPRTAPKSPSRTTRPSPPTRPSGDAPA